MLIDGITCTIHVIMYKVTFFVIRTINNILNSHCILTLFTKHFQIEGCGFIIKELVPKNRTPV